MRRKTGFETMVTKYSIFVFLTLAAVASAVSPSLAATAGLPFTEDFTASDLMDGSKTTANWDTDAQMVTLAYRKTLANVFKTPAATDMTADIFSTQSMASADMDGDGDIDLVSADYGTLIRLYKNNGSGVFLGSDLSAASYNTYSVALGDVDGDGDMDAVAANADQANRLYLNDGAGTFIGSDITADAHNSRSAVLADFNGDGHLDLAVGNYGQASRLYLNNGTADPFGGVTGTNITTDAYNTSQLISADFNGDGYPDIASANYGQANRLYLNDGAGDPFDLSVGVSITTDAHSTYSLAAGDIEGDGDVDLVAGNYGQTNRLYLNNGTSNPFNGTVGQDTTADAGNTWSVALCDIDNDGDFDLVAGNYGQANRVYLNNGTSTPFNGVSGANAHADAFNTSIVALADFDADGDLDMATGNYGQKNRLYLNDGTHMPFADIAAGEFSTNAYDSRAVAAADINGDGKLDVVVGNYGQVNQIFYNNGTSTPFEGVTGVDISTDTHNTVAIAIADVDSANGLDVVVGNYGQVNRLYLNNGSGVFTGYNITADAHNTTSIAVANVNGAGNLDIVAGNYGQTNRLYINDGAGDPFDTVTGTDITADAHNTSSIAVADVNGAGGLDIVAGNYGQANRLYLNDGAGDPFDTVSGTDITTDANNTRAILLANVDGAGNLDVVVGNYGEVNRLYLNDGAGDPFDTVTGRNVTADTHNTYAMAAVDLDGDTKLDLIAANVGQTNRIYTNNATADPFNGVTGRNLSADTLSTYGLATGNFDSDTGSKIDIVVVDSYAVNKVHCNDGAAAASSWYSTASGRVESARVDAEGAGFTSAKLIAVANSNTAATRNTRIDYFLTNNGTQWYPVKSGTPVVFSVSGTDLRWKAVLRSLSPKITPELTSVQVDISPILGLAAGNLAYTENDPAAKISASTTVTYSKTMEGWTLTSRVSSGSDASDRLSIEAVGNVTIVGTDVKYSGVPMGTANVSGGVVTGSSSLVVTLNPSADAGKVADLIEAISYSSVSDGFAVPGPTTKVVSVTLTDGANVSTGEKKKTVEITGVNDAPTLTAFSAAVDTVNEDTQVEITFAEIAAKGDENDPDGSITAFIVTAITTGALKIGSDSGSAAVWAAGTNETIDATKKAYWTPAANANGSLNAFAVKAKDNTGTLSAAGIDVPVSVTSVNDSPTFTSFTTVVDSVNEDTQVEITFADLAAQGDEADIDGSVAAFVVKSITTGTLKIGASAGTATDWFAGVNDHIKQDGTKNAYWTPAANATGTLNAFAVVAKDDGGISTTTNVIAQVTVNAVNDPPTLTSFSAAVDTVAEDTEVEITLAELLAKGDESDIEDGAITAFIVTSVTTGTLKIGADSGSAGAWVATTNDLVDATKKAYWTPAVNANGTLNAFAVKAKDSGALLSATAVTVQVTVTSVNDAPTLTAFSAAVDSVNEDTQVEITFEEMTAKGDEADADGTVTGFVVKSVDSGTLKIGASISLALPWAATTNDLLNTTKKAYWTPAANASGTLNAYSVVARDSGGATSTGGNIVVQVTVNAVNDAPTLDVISNPAAIDEDSPQQTVNLAGIGTGAVNEVQTLGVTAVSDNVGLIPNPTVTYTTPNATGSLAYTPVANAYGSAVVTVTVTDAGLNGSLGDGDDGTVVKQFTVTVNSVNDVPVFTAFAGAVDSTDEDTQVEITLADLAAQGDEADPNDSAGSIVAFIVQSVATGALRIGADSNSSSVWSAGTNETISSTLKAYWTPAADSSGTINAFAVVAKDNGGLTSISGSVTAQVTVNAVNDAPTMNSFAASVVTGTEDLETAITFANIAAQANEADVDGTVDAFVVKAVSSGTLKIGADSGSATPWAAGTNDLLEGTTPKNAYWTPATNANGTVNAFTVVAKDNSGVESSTPVSVPVDLSAANDNPVFSGLPTDAAFTEDTQGNLDLSAGTFSDPDSASGSVALTLTGGAGSVFTSASSGGVVVSGSGTNAMVITGTAASIEAFLGTAANVKYKPASNLSGNDADTVAISANDGGNTGAGGGGAVALGSVNIDITAVNDPPTIDVIANPAAIAEDAAEQTINLAGIGSGAADEAGQALTVAASSANIALIPNPITVTYTSPNATGTLKYTPTANASGTAVITVTVTDAGLDLTPGNGDDGSIQRQFTVTVNSVNDPPTLTAFSAAVDTVNEDTQVEITFDELKAKGDEADIDGTIASFVVKSVTSGALRIGATSGTSTVWAATSNDVVNATRRAYWTPASNVNGAAIEAFKVVAKDNGGDVSSGAGIAVTVTVNAVNDAPTLTSFAAPVDTVNEDSEVEITFAELAAQGNEADPEDGAVTSFIVKGVATGTLRIGANTGAATAWAATTNDIVDGTKNAYWIPALNASGTINAFTLNVSDTGGLKSAVNVYAQVSVTAINDDPTMTSIPAAMTFTEDTAGNFDISAAALSDPDAGSGTFSLTLTAGAGATLTATGTTLVTVTGSGTNVLLLTGTAASIDTYLNTATNIKYKGAPNTAGAGADSVALQGNDGGSTGVGGGGNVAFGAVAINLTAVNDAPTLTSFAAAVDTVNEDTEVEITFAELVAAGDEADVDGTVDAFVVGAVSSGTLKIGANQGAATPWAATGNDIIDATHLGYWTPAANANGAIGAFTVVARDNTGSKSTPAVAVSVTVTPVNDAPTFTDFSTFVDTVNEDTQVEITFAELSSKADEADIDGTVTGFVVKVLSSGTLKIGADSGTATPWAATTNDLVDATHLAYWTPAANAYGTLNAFEAVARDDGGAESTGNGICKVKVNAVNDSPVQVQNQAINTLEDVPKVIDATLLSHTDVDNTAAQITYTVGTAPAHGTLFVDTNANLIADNDSEKIVAAETFTQAAVDAGTLIYTPAAEYSGADSFTFTVSDGSGGTLPLDTAGITVTILNDAPVFAPVNPLTITEDNTTFNGISFSFVFSSAFSDLDGNSFVGVAIGGNDAVAGVSGTWQYSTDNRVNWYDVSPVTTAQALLLPASAMVRFVPVSNYNGTTSLAVFAVENSAATTWTSGATRQYYDTVSDTPTSRVSVASTPLAMAVSAVNDAPSFSGAANMTSIFEDCGDDDGSSADGDDDAKKPSNNQGQTISSALSAKFVDVDSDAFGGIAVSADGADGTTQGTWQYSTGTAWFAMGTVSTASALLLPSTARLRFLPIEDFNGQPGGLTVFAVDGSGSTTWTADGTRRTFDTTTDDQYSKVSGSSVTLGITVTAVDDMPDLVCTAGTAAFIEDDGPMAIDPTLTIQANDGGTYDGAMVAVTGGFVTAEDILSFTPAYGVTGSFDSATGILTMTGSANETQYQEILRSVTYVDSNQVSPNTGTRTVTFTMGTKPWTGSGHYYRFVNTQTTWTAARAAADASKYLGLQGYLATVSTEAEGLYVGSLGSGATIWLGASDAAANLTWRWVTGPEGLEDSAQGRHFFTQAVAGGGASAGGYYSTWELGEPNDWNGNPENYACAFGGADWLDTIDADANVTGYVIEYGDMPGDPVLSITGTRLVSVTSVDDLPYVANAIADVTASEDAVNKTIDLSAVFGDIDNPVASIVKTVNSNTNTALISATISGNTLTLDYKDNKNGAATVTIRGTSNGKTIDDVFDVTVVAVNDVPSFAKGADQTVNEDAGSISVTGWATSISPGPSDESAQTLTFTVSNDNNGLFSEQPAVDSSGVLTYAAVAEASGTANLSIYLKDSGGTSYGGVDTSATQTFKITVNAINDPPTLAVIANPAMIDKNAGEQTINLSGIGTGAVNETQTLSVTASSGNTGLIPHPTVTYTSPNATGTLKYLPVIEASGTATVTVTVTDAGFDGILGNADDATVQRQFVVLVNSMSDPPKLDAIANPAAIDEDSAEQTINLSGIEKGATNQFPISVTALSDNTDLIPDPTIVYTSPNLTGTLKYTPVANANGTAVVTVTVRDSGYDGTAGNGDDGITQRQFTVTVNPVNDSPTLTAFSAAVATAVRDTEQEITLADLKSKGNEADIDGTVDAFVVMGVGSGTLKIGANSGAASAWAIGTNDTIDSGNMAYWTPPAGQIGSFTAFSVVAIDDSGDASPGLGVDVSVTVIAVNALPTLTAFSSAVDSGAEDTEVEITFAELVSKGDEADSDGSITAFKVKSVSTGTLTMGFDSASATAWEAGVNDLVDIVTKAYWTPGANDSGDLEAFLVTAVDDASAESAGAGIAVTVTVSEINDPPTFTAFSAAVAITAKDEVAEITFADLLSAGNEADVDGTVTAFVVKSVMSGTLVIGADAGSALAWASGTNDMIDASNTGYWTPVPDYSGTAGAFSVKALDDDGAESATAAVTALVSVRSGSIPPTFSAFSGPVASGSEDSQFILSFASLTAVGDETDQDGAVDAFLIKSVITGTLKIGETVETATLWEMGTNDAITATLNGYWTPAANATGTIESLAMVARDDGGLESLEGNVTATVTVTAVNDAPVLTAPDPVVLTVMYDSEVSPAGMAVFDLLEGLADDSADLNSVMGIAVTSATALSAGKWQYMPVPQGTWADLPSVSASAALLLGESAEVRYLPASGDSGTASLLFRAWDKTSGTESSAVSQAFGDASANGGATAFSLAEGTLSQTIVGRGLTVVLASATVAENSGKASGGMTISIPGSLADDLPVAIHSDRPERLILPLAAVIPAGSQSVNVDLTPFDNNFLDGTAQVTITAGAQAWMAGTATLTITDDEVAGLTLSVQPEAGEASKTAVFTLRSASIPLTDVAITLSSNSARITVPATATLAARANTVTFAGTVVDNDLIDGNGMAVVTAVAQVWGTATSEITILDDEKKTMKITLPSTISEGAGAVAEAGTVNLGGKTVGALTVSLISSDDNVLTVPASVTVPSGSSFVKFTLTPVDNATVQGDRAVTISCQAAGFTGQPASMVVTDDDSASRLSVTGPSEATEGGAPFQLTVSLTPAPVSATTVTVALSGSSRVSAPAQIQVAAGASSATLTVTVADNSAFDGVETCLIDVSAPDYSKAVYPVTVLDDEKRALSVTVTASAVEGDGVVAGGGRVTIPAPLLAPLTVTLFSTDVTEATVPASVQIPAGSTEAVFDLTVMADTVYDRASASTIWVRADGWEPASATVQVFDPPAAELETTRFVKGTQDARVSLRVTPNTRVGPVPLDPSNPAGTKVEYKSSLSLGFVTVKVNPASILPYATLGTGTGKQSLKVTDLYGRNLAALTALGLPKATVDTVKGEIRVELAAPAGLSENPTLRPMFISFTGSVSANPPVGLDGISLGSVTATFEDTVSSRKLQALPGDGDLGGPIVTRTLAYVVEAPALPPFVDAFIEASPGETALQAAGQTFEYTVFVAIPASAANLSDKVSGTGINDLRVTIPYGLAGRTKKIVKHVGQAVNSQLPAGTELTPGTDFVEYIPSASGGAEAGYFFSGGLNVTGADAGLTLEIVFEASLEAGSVNSFIAATMALVDTSVPSEATGFRVKCAPGNGDGKIGNWDKPLFLVRLKSAPPAISGLAAQEASLTAEGLVTATAATVKVYQACNLSWQGNDPDSPFVTHLFWSLYDLTASAALAEIGKSQSKLVPICTGLEDLRRSSTPVVSSHTWNVSAIRSTQGVFALDALDSNPIHVYAAAADRDNPPSSSAGQVIKGDFTIVLSKLPIDDSPPECSVEPPSGSQGATQVTADASVSIGVKVADDGTAPVRVDLYFSGFANSIRAVPCLGTDQAPLSFQAVPGSATLSGAQASYNVWDTSRVPNGVYMVLARVTAAGHRTQEAWSSFGVSVVHASVEDISPSFEWLKPSFTVRPSPSPSTFDVEYEVRDEDGDALKVSIYCNDLDVEDSGLVLLDGPIDFAATLQSVTREVAVDLGALPAGAYYLLAVIEEPGRAGSIPSKVWTDVPVVVDRSMGIGDLAFSVPYTDPNDSSSFAADIAFRTSAPGIGTVSYGTDGVIFERVTDDGYSMGHLLTIHGIAPGETVLFKVSVEDDEANTFEMDNFGRLYRLKVPALAAAASERWVKGMVSGTVSATVKAYLVKTSADSEQVSEPFTVRTGDDGVFMLDIGSALSFADQAGTREAMAPAETDALRVEILFDDGKRGFYDSISLTGLDGATTSDLAIELPGLWNLGSGVSVSTELLEVTIDLVKGFNMISLPMEAATPLKASDFLTLIGDGAVVIYAYSAASGGYSSYMPLAGGGGVGTDFEVDLSAGLFVKMSEAKSFTFSGKKISKPMDIPVLKGFNLIGNPFGRDFPARRASGLSAEDLISEVGLDAVALYVYSNGSYHIVVRTGVNDDGSFSFYSTSGNLDLPVGGGYFLKMLGRQTFRGE